MALVDSLKQTEHVAGESLGDKVQWSEIFGMVMNRLDGNRDRLCSITPTVKKSNSHNGLPVTSKDIDGD